MELKVWCDGIQRVVCGVSVQTTCQDVVFALAHATAQTGRFILIERWRNSERLLAPSEHPLTVLSKWGEYANDVTFVMKRSEHHNKTNANTALNQSQSPHHLSTASPLQIGSPPASGGTGSGLSSPNRRDLLNLINNNKSIYMSLNRKSTGLTQTSGSSPSTAKPLTSTPINPNSSSNTTPNPSPLKSNSCPNSSHNNSNSIAKTAIDSTVNELTKQQMNNKNNNSIELTPTKTAPTAGQRPRHPPPYSEAIYQSALISNSGQTNTTSSSHLVPTTDTTNASNKRRSAEPSPQSQKQRTGGTTGSQKELTLHRDAIRLVDMQKDAIKSQEKEMSSLEQQICTIEQRLEDNEDLITRYKDEMEACHQLWLDQEVLIDQMGEQSQLEEELDQLVITATAYEEEMATLKKKLSQCETDIGDCRQKISKLMDQLEDNERVARNKIFDKEEKERELMDQLRTALRDKNCDLESQKNDLQILTNNMKQFDSVLNEKTTEVERLLSEIKEANIQGLALQTATEQKHNSSSRGQSFQNRSGSTRRMIGSPRELENAVATNKNPHGVWV